MLLLNNVREQVEESHYMKEESGEVSNETLSLLPSLPALPLTCC